MGRIAFNFLFNQFYCIWSPMIITIIGYSALQFYFSKIISIVVNRCFCCCQYYYCGYNCGYYCGYYCGWHDG